METIEVTESGNRQIRARPKVAELLSDRRDDIDAAVAEAADVIQHSLEGAPDSAGWKVIRLEANFGIKLKADAGVILTRVGAEASFDVRIVVERTSRDA